MGRAGDSGCSVSIAAVTVCVTVCACRAYGPRAAMALISTVLPPAPPPSLPAAAYVRVQVSAARMPAPSSLPPTTSARCLVFQVCVAASRAPRDAVVQVKLFKWPCVAPAPACRQYCAHSSHVHSVRFTKSDQYLVTLVLLCRACVDLLPREALPTGLHRRSRHGCCAGITSRVAIAASPHASAVAA